MSPGGKTRIAGGRPSALRTDPTPLYYKLEGILRAGIESRQYAPGSGLPTERELEELYGVSRITVRRALEALQRDGLVWRGRGRRGGTFVNDAPREKETTLFGSLDALFSVRQISRVDLLAFEVRPCPPDIAAGLRLPAGTEVRYIERALSTRAGPLAQVRNFLPLAYGAKLREADLKTRMLHQVLRRRGVRIKEVQDEVSALVADSQTATTLGIRSGSAVLFLRRIFLDATGRRVNLTAMLLRTDRYRMSVRLRDERLE